MPHAFEELVGREIDSLYQGALFLCGGSESEAGDLLVRTLRTAFRTYTSGGVDGDFGRWLEGRLAVRFLEEAGEDRTPAEDLELPGGEGAGGAGPGPGAPSASPVDLERLDARSLHRAGASVPSRARAALWLVLLCRWSYRKSAELMGASMEELRALLTFRSTLLASALEERGDGEGVDGWGAKRGRG